MNNNVEIIPKICLNVMEELVQEEIVKQFKLYPRSLAEYINKIEVSTYALNRLPPLYASCEKGKYQQKLLGKRQYKKQITIAVRQGIAAVQRDPLRVSTPLLSEMTIKYQQAETALKDLERFLELNNLTNFQTLSWANVVSVVQKAFEKITWKSTQQDSVPSVEQPSEPQEDSWFKRRKYYSNKVNSST